MRIFSIILSVVMSKTQWIIVSLFIAVMTTSQCKPRRSTPSAASPGSASTAPVIGDDSEYKVDEKNQLMKRDKDGNWVVVDKNVKSFQKSKSGDIYVVTTDKKLKIIRNGITTPMGSFGDKATLSLNDSSEPSAATLTLGDVEPPPQEYLPDDLTDYKIGDDGVLLKKGEGESEWSVFTYEVRWRGTGGVVPYHVQNNQGNRSASVNRSNFARYVFENAFGEERSLVKKVPGATEYTPLDVQDLWYNVFSSGTHILPHSGVTVEKLKNVEMFFKAPNGYLYVWTQNHDLQLIRYGIATIPLFNFGLHSMAMDKNGTGYWEGVLDYLESNWAENKTRVLPPTREEVYCTSFPSPAIVMKAAHMTSRDQYFEPQPGEPASSGVFADPKSDFRDVQIAVEPAVDRIEELRMFPGIGLGRTHMCQYLAIIYYISSADLVRRRTTIWIGMNEVIRESAAPANAPRNESKNGGHVASLPVVPKQAIFRNSMSMSSGSGGTIYKFGHNQYLSAADFGGGASEYSVGQEFGPLELWRLPWGAPTWQYEGRVYAFAESSEGTLYVLNSDRELKSLAKGSTQWKTVDKRVQSFSMGPNGKLYTLSNAGILRMQEREGGRWTLLDVGVKSFAMAPDGTVNELNNRGQLRRYAGSSIWSMLDSGVRHVEFPTDGLVYELNNRGQLKRLAVSGVWTVLDTGIKSFRRDSKGILYSLNTSHQLKQLTSIEWVTVDDLWRTKMQKYSLNWKTIANNIDSFEVGPSMLNDVYTLSRTGVLSKYYTPMTAPRFPVSELAAPGTPSFWDNNTLNSEGTWRKLRTGIKRLSMDLDGLVEAVDKKNTSWLFAPTLQAPLLDPVEGNMFCSNPTDQELDNVFKAAHIPKGPGVSLSMELTGGGEIELSNAQHYALELADHVNPTARFTVVGLHTVVPFTCLYQGTISFAAPRHRKPVNIFVDLSKLAIVGSSPDQFGEGFSWGPSQAGWGASTGNTYGQIWMK